MQSSAAWEIWHFGNVIARGSRAVGTVLSDKSKLAALALVFKAIPSNLLHTIGLIHIFSDSKFALLRAFDLSRHLGRFWSHICSFIAHEFLSVLLDSTIHLHYVHKKMNAAFLIPVHVAATS